MAAPRQVQRTDALPSAGAKGTVRSGFGDKLDRARGEMLAAGSSFSLPAEEAHYLWNDDEAVVLLVATGPWGISYVNPKDDPRSASR